MKKAERDVSNDYVLLGQMHATFACARCAEGRGRRSGATRSTARTLAARRRIGWGGRGCGQRAGAMPRRGKRTQMTASGFRRAPG